MQKLSASFHSENGVISPEYFAKIFIVKYLMKITIVRWKDDIMLMIYCILEERKAQGVFYHGLQNYSYVAPKIVIKCNPNAWHDDTYKQVCYMTSVFRYQRTK